MSDLAIPYHEGDIEFEGTVLCAIIQADDVALLSTSIKALQLKINVFVDWCAKCGFMSVNMIKSLAMAFGSISHKEDLILYIGDTPMLWTIEYTFIGVTFTCTHRNIFKRHYSTKQNKAAHVVRAALAAEGYTGPLPILEGLLLYLARVDPHLTFGLLGC
ncbi:hypothetical protein QCA50_018031 [Cerrena zonata]|uniref:Reverse transcriptase n=1 Tax=Cerrena zonata TaxID=2478898 RepID=A0AAW0FE57_9APHY